jgi:hypothetical protein
MDEEHQQPIHYAINLLRLILVETAEDRATWFARARKQWGGGKPIAVRLSSSSAVFASTAPMGLELQRQWCGVNFEEDGVIYDAPHLAESDGMLVIEVVSAGVVPMQILGIAVVNLRSFILERRLSGRNSVLVFPASLSSEATVHAVLDLEVRTTSSLTLADELQGGPAGPAHRPSGTAMSPLEYSFGCLRLSSLDLYFPSFLIDSSKEGEYIVSNVICAYNNTEDEYLTLSFVQRGLSPITGGGLVVHPAEAVVVRPQQRAYFSVTWNVSSPQPVQTPELELSVVGGPHQGTQDGLTAPVVFRVHFSAPRPDDLDSPFQFWINTTCLTNRTMSHSSELPYIKSVLPIFFLIEKAATGTQGTDDAILVRNIDNGASVMVAGGPSMLVPSPRASDAAVEQLLDLTDTACECVLSLGTLVGFPVPSSSSQHGALTCSFRIIATVTKADGWSLLSAETEAHYQLPSGRIPWNETIRLQKKRGADCRQFMKLHLVEVSPRDDDETPVGSAIVSLSSLTHIRSRSATVHAAFFIYDCCSLYDDLASGGALLKGCSLHFVT